MIGEARSKRKLDGEAAKQAVDFFRSFSDRCRNLRVVCRDCERFGRPLRGASPIGGQSNRARGLGRWTVMIAWRERHVIPLDKTTRHG